MRRWTDTTAPTTAGPAHVGDPTCSWCWAVAPEPDSGAAEIRLGP